MRILRSILGAAFAAILAVGLFALAPPSLAAKGKPKPSKNLMVWLAPTGVTPDAWGKVKFKSVKKQTGLRVELHGLTPGDYSVEVGGVDVGTVTVRVDSGTGEEFGKLDLRTRSGGPVTFDPRGKQVRILNDRSSAVELACEDFPENDEEELAKTEIEAAFTPTAEAPLASGQAEYEEFRGRATFEVEVAGLPQGYYDLIVGGVKQGTFSVGADGHGEIEFDSLPDGIGDDPGADQPGDDAQGDDDHQGNQNGEENAADPDEAEGGGPSQDEGDLLLTFDPRGQSVQIVQGALIFLEIPVFPAL